MFLDFTISMTRDKEENVKVNNEKLTEVMNFVKMLEAKKYPLLSQIIKGQSLYRVELNGDSLSFTTGTFDFRRGFSNYGTVADFIFNFITDIKEKINKDSVNEKL